MAHKAPEPRKPGAGFCEVRLRRTVLSGRHGAFVHAGRSLRESLGLSSGYPHPKDIGGFHLGLSF